MSDMKPKGTKIKLGKNEYGIRFTLNAIDDIQEHFDIPIADLGKLIEDSKNQIKTIKCLLAILINEDIDCTADETGERLPHVDERYVGRYIDVSNMVSVVSAISEALAGSMPEQGDAPNAKGE